MYSVSSSELTKYINEKYIQHGQRLEGALFLDKVLRKHVLNNLYRSQLAVLIGQFRELARLKTMGAIEIVDGVPINKVVASFQLLLKTIETDSNRILIKKTVLERKAPDIFKFEYHGKKSKTTPKKPKGKSKLIRFGLIGIALAIAMLIGFKECSTSYLDSPLSQVTSWQNPQADNWAVYLRSFRTLEDAKLEQGSFPNRSIDIVRLNNGKFYLFIFADNEKEAKGQHTSTVKERWEKSRVIPFDRCTKSPNGRNGYFNCE